MKKQDTVVGVFEDRNKAQQAINELKRVGFSDDQIGLTARETGSTAKGEVDETATEGDNYAGEGATAGLAAGAGVGALWGLGIAAGILPGIGPAIAGGTLAAILSSAAAGAAAAGLGGTLIGLGIPKDEAEYYEGQMSAGHVVVTVQADGRHADAVSILRRFGGYDMRSRAAQASDSSLHSQTGASDVHGRSTAAGTSATTSSGMQHSKAPTGTCHEGSESSTGASRSTKGIQASDSERTIQAKEEQLKINKEKKTTGEVIVRKDVKTEHVTVDVPVQKEEVVIERRAVTGQTAATESIGPSDAIRIPVTEEQVRVEKQPVVKEEITVGKRTTEHIEHVGADVKKEEIKVEKRGKTQANED